MCAPRYILGGLCGMVGLAGIMTGLWLIVIPPGFLRNLPSPWGIILIMAGIALSFFIALVSTMSGDHLCKVQDRLEEQQQQQQARANEKTLLINSQV